MTAETEIFADLEMQRFRSQIYDRGIFRTPQVPWHSRLGDGQTHEHSIFRTPPGMLRANRDAFEPETVSIGPYHDGSNVERLKAMQVYKQGYLNKFLKRNPNMGKYDYFKDPKRFVDKARKCYSEVVIMDDGDFINLLLLDGSFIVELLRMLWDRRKANQEGPTTPVASVDLIVDTRWTLGFLAEDLLKMENQVPFFVLRDLYNLSVAVPLIETPSITDLAYNFAQSVATSIGGEQVEIKRPSPEEEDNIQHLLHFCHSCFFAGRGQRREANCIINTIPTVEDLTKAGVKIKLKERGRICKVTFSRGILQMTPTVFYDSTDVIFHNLIALEECYPSVGVHMTGYSYFLDSLIDTSADVRLLRQLGVVHNRLGSDKKLADVVNNLCHDVAGHLPEEMAWMFMNVNTYCSHSWPTWRAKFVNDYFGNPWAIISLIAAFILLLLTVLQTLFSILSYFK